jgi:hypothetical protein
VDVRLISAGHIEPHRLGAGREQEPVIGQAFTVSDDNFPMPGIDAGNCGLQSKIDAVLGIEIVGAQRQPVLRRRAGKIILR